MKKITRRDFLKGSVAAGAFMAFGGRGSLFLPSSAHAFTNSPALTKWLEPIRNIDILARPGIDNAVTIPTLSFANDTGFPGALFGQVTISEFQDVLHPELTNNPTYLWGYRDSTTSPSAQRHLGALIVANRAVATRIRFTNTLPATSIIPVDTTIPGANQQQNRTAVHQHGGFVPWISDGGPFDWWSPGGAGHATGLSFQNGPGSVLDNIPGNGMVAGQADYYYPNDQSTRLTWYHDHAFGITRTNAYAGIASGFLILDAVNAEYTRLGKIPGLGSTIPLVFQDKIFVNDPANFTDSNWSTVAPSRVQAKGNLWYAHTYEPDRWRLVKGGKYLAPPDPSVVAEFFGDTMLCNGTVSPFVTVEAKRYRFFVLNACNARFLNINLLEVPVDGEVQTDPGTLLPLNTPTNPAPPPGPPIIQIGTEGGFLITETILNNTNFIDTVNFKGNLFLGPAERADIIIDFTGLAGREFVMYGDAPAPFPGGDPRNDYFAGNPNTPQALAGTSIDTRNLVKFKVIAGASDPQPAGTILDPGLLDPPPLALPDLTGVLVPIATPAVTRNLTLNEDFDKWGRLRQLLGTTKPNLVTKGFGLDYLAPATEVANVGDVEVWRIFNLTGDTHPIHFHLVNVQVMSRQPFKMLYGKFTPTGTARGPEPDELGWKETVKMNPGEVTTVIMKFDLPTVPFEVPSTNRASAMGLTNPNKNYYEYVWHCHILEHEEHDMMRPLIVQENKPV